MMDSFETPLRSQCERLIHNDWTGDGFDDETMTKDFVWLQKSFKAIVSNDINSGETYTKWFEKELQCVPLGGDNTFYRHKNFYDDGR